MKLLGNTLEKIHKFRHDHLPSHRLPVRTNHPYARLSLLYLDTNDTYYLVDNASAIFHSLHYNDGAIVVSEWIAAELAGLKKSYAQPGFDNYFQMLVQNTAEAYDAETHQQDV